MGNLTMGSLFDGSGGFPLGAVLLGITPVWASEVEPFCVRVTTKRFPQMKHLGDINIINGAEIESVDIVTFGSPCTNMSVAGKREGLTGEQSILFYQAIRVIKEMRCATNGRKPRFIVWENVPGAYSSAGGSDFREVLSEIVKIKDGSLSVPMPESGKWLPSGEIVGDGFSVAYRCIDAQFFGVAQRRRRCYLVADFDGECAGKILFESEGVSGYSPQGFGAGQGTAGHAEGGAGEAGCTVLNDQGGSCMDISENITGTLRAEEHGHQPCVIQSAGFCAEQSAKTRGVGFENEKSPTIRAGVIPGTVLSFEPGAASRLGGHAWDDTAGTLRADMGDNMLAVVMPAAGFMSGQGEKAGSIGYGEEISPTIKGEAGGNSTPCVLAPGRFAAAIENHPSDSRIKLDESGTVQTLTGRMGTGGGNVPLIMNERQHAMTIDSETAGTLISTDYKGTQCVFEPTPQTLKIRSGCEERPEDTGARSVFFAERKIMSGGKGTLLQDNKSATLSCNNDQTVFVPFRKGTRPHSKDEGQKWEPAEIVNTLNTFDSGESRCNELAVKTNAVPVAYGICSDASNAMRSGNPDSGIYEAETSRTLDGNGGNPSCNQGGMAVVAPYITDKDNVTYSLDRASYNQGKNAQFDISITEEQSQTLVARGPHAVAQPASFYPQMKAESQCFRQDGTANTIVNGTNPGFQNGIVEPEYTVRRLVPQECAMLQGFPPDWCANLETSEPGEDEIAWWSEVFETHRKIVGTSGKPKSRNQIVKWLQNPHSDAAEYKMWGNGVALPCVRFVMAGIAWAAELS